MKKLKFKENECSEPVSLDIKTFEKYMADRCLNVISNGVTTHVIGNPDIKHYDIDKIQDAVLGLIVNLVDYDTLKVSESFKESRVQASPELILTAKKNGNNIVFNSVVVKPEFE